MAKKKLNTDVLKEKNEKYKESKEVVVLEEYYVNLRPNISNKDTAKIFTDFGAFMQDKVVLSAIPDDENIINYFICCIVKNQTDLFDNIEYDKTNIGLYRVFRVLLDSRAIDEILSYIDKKDLILLYSKYNDVIKVGMQVEKIINKIDKMSNKHKKNKVESVKNEESE